MEKLNLKVELNLKNKKGIKMEVREVNIGTTPIKASHVNWKGLYQDCKYAWITLFSILLTIFIVVVYLTSQGYFTHRIVNQQVEKVQVLEVLEFFGKKVLIKGKITGDVPIEVPLPRDCDVNKKWIGKDITIDVITQYKQYNNSEFYEFRKIEQICH